MDLYLNNTNSNCDVGALREKGYTHPRILVHTVNSEETKIYLLKKNNLKDRQVLNGIDIDL